MNIVLLGGSGFIGSQTAHLLRQRGHHLTMPSHSDLNLLQLNESSAKKYLAHQDLVINTIGVMSRHADILEIIHHHAPLQLAKWAQEMGVSRWLQLSALGADAGHKVAFVGSKGRGDDALCQSGLQVNIARPSVVFGRGGTSCELFIKMAKCPFLILPNIQTAKMQPVHVFDVAEGLANLAENPLAHGTVVKMVGASAHTLADYLRALRQYVHGKPHLSVFPMPISLMKPLFPLTNIISNGFLSSDSMTLLQEGSVADKADFVALLGREPLAVCEFPYEQK